MRSSRRRLHCGFWKLQMAIRGSRGSGLKGWARYRGTGTCGQGREMKAHGRRRGCHYRAIRRTQWRRNPLRAQCRREGRASNHYANGWVSNTSILAMLELICGQQRPTGTMPLVREVGYVYALLPSVFRRIFCSSNGMSRPWAVADSGRGAATATEAPTRRREV